MKRETTEDIFSALLSIQNEEEKDQAEVEHPRMNGVTIGKLTDINEMSHALVDFMDNFSRVPLIAKSIVRVTNTDIGREIVLMFESGNWENPVIMGFIQGKTTSLDEPIIKHTENLEKSPISIDVDGKRINIQAEDRIVFRCGEASITLTNAGKILLRGTYVVSRSSGVNRIKGGSVQIN